MPGWAQGQKGQRAKALLGAVITSGGGPHTRSFSTCNPTNLRSRTVTQSVRCRAGWLGGKTKTSPFFTEVSGVVRDGKCTLN